MTPRDDRISEASAGLEQVVRLLVSQQGECEIRERIFEWALKLQRLAQAIARAAEEHGARCYAAYLTEENMPPAEAEALGWLIPRLGAQFQERRLAQRSAAQLLNGVVTAKTTLVISRRARVLRAHCEHCSKIGQALFGLGLTDSWNDLRALLTAASERDANACLRLQKVAAGVYKTLPKSRGQNLTLESATHAVFLALLREEGKRWTYTWNHVEEYFSDARTAVTSKVFGRYNSSGQPAFKPRSAHNLVRAGAVR